MATSRDPRPIQRQETTKALLRAHLSAAASYGHSTRSCAVCHRLRRFVAEHPLEPSTPPTLSAAPMRRPRRSAGNRLPQEQPPAVTDPEPPDGS